MLLAQDFPIITSTSKNSRFSFGKDRRLLKSHEFSRVFDKATIRISHPSFLILAVTNDLDHPRLGLVIPKKQVKLAVGRNRIKRVARESFRLQQHKLPSIDAIVLARKGAKDVAPSDQLQIFNDLWKRTIKRALKVQGSR